MEKIISSHKELKEYLKEQNWKEDISNVFSYPIEENPYELNIFINPFEKRHFFIYNSTPYHTRREMVFYKMGRQEKIVDVISEIEKEVQIMTEDLLHYQTYIREKEESKQTILGLVKNEFNKNEKKGYYYLSFPNKMEIFLFLLPNNYGFEVSFPLNRSKSEYSSKTYQYKEKDAKEFIASLKEKEEKIPYLNGWVTPIDDEEYKKSYKYESFYNGDGDNKEKAKEYHDILYQILDKEYTHYIFSFIYNDDQKEDDHIDIEISKDKPFLKEYAEEITDKLKILTRKYSFLRHDDSYLYTGIFKIDLNEIEINQLKQFTEEWNESIKQVVG